MKNEQEEHGSSGCFLFITVLIKGANFSERPKHTDSLFLSHELEFHPGEAVKLLRRTAREIGMLPVSVVCFDSHETHGGPLMAVVPKSARLEESS